MVFNIQDGFGWTNGVILDLLNLYGSSLSAPPLVNITNTTNTTDTNPTDMGSSSNNDRSNNDRSNNTVWVIPIAVIVPLIFLCVVCIIWGRWVYKRGKKRYWQRVHNEHLMAYGATDDSGQGYNIGELYENKYFDTEHEELNKTNDHAVKGNEDERRKSLPRQNASNEQDWYEQTEDVTSISVATAMRITQQEDSGILSNRTSDNISDNTTVDRNDGNNNSPSQGRNDDNASVHGDDDTEDDGHKRDASNNDQRSQENVLKDEHLEEVTVHEDTTQATREPTPEKVLTTDV